MTEHPIYDDLAQGEPLYKVIEAAEKPYADLAAAVGIQVEFFWLWWFGMFRA